VFQIVKFALIHYAAVVDLWVLWLLRAAMGSSSSKFRKHIQSGDEYAAIHLYSSSSDLRKALDPNLSYGDSYSHDTPMHMVARHAM